MRLTEIHRKAFVRAVMADVPKVDYQEQAEALIKQAVYDSMPDAVKKIYDNKELRGHLGNERISTPYGLNDVYVAGAAMFSVSESLYLKLQDLAGLKKKQTAEREAMTSRLMGAIKACSTLKRAQELFPEFINYLPAEEAKTNNLPAVHGIVADLAKAGWPKGKKK